MPRCRSCGAEIAFQKTAAGRLMPCEKNLVYCLRQAGAKETVILQSGDVVRAEIVGKDTKGAVLGYRPHWGSCPGAQRFKR